jgi:hypothetical protein
MSLATLLQTGIRVTENEAVQEFPDGVRFRISANSPQPIERVELEFGTDELTCQETTQQAVPEDFVPATEIQEEWHWNLRRDGTLPPGTEIWWQWHLEDAAGNSLTTELQTLTFSDDTFNWETRQTDEIRLHTHHGGPLFADQLFDAAVDGLVLIEELYGIGPTVPVDLFIYADASEMQSATLFAPAWSGGRAFPSDSAILIGISIDEVDWGVGTIVHELVHIVQGQYTLSCVDSTPPWIAEGLAEVAEGEMESYYAVLLSDAIEDNQLHSVKELGFAFSADPELARLAYAQSHSLVRYLLETYGDQELVALLDNFREGNSPDSALSNVYGMDRDQLEVAWREWVGAPPSEEIEQLEATATPTEFPTIQPIVGNSGEATSGPTAMQTAVPTPVAIESADTEEPAGGLCASLGAIAVLSLGARRLRHSRGPTKEKDRS